MLSPRSRRVTMCGVPPLAFVKKGQVPEDDDVTATGSQRGRTSIVDWIACGNGQGARHCTLFRTVS